MTDQYLSLLSKILGGSLCFFSGGETLLLEHLAQAAALKHLWNVPAPP